jgi:hypothetical protein
MVSRVGTRYTLSVRKIVLLTVAGLGSGYGSWFGVASWMRAEAQHSQSELMLFYCFFPALSLVIFLSYFALPRVGVAMAWLVLTGSFVASYLVRLMDCVRHACTTADSLRVGWGTLTEDRHLWVLSVAAFCLLLDYTAPATSAPVVLDPD